MVKTRSKRKAVEDGHRSAAEMSSKKARREICVMPPAKAPVCKAVRPRRRCVGDKRPVVSEGGKISASCTRRNQTKRGNLAAVESRSDVVGRLNKRRCAGRGEAAGDGGSHSVDGVSSSKGLSDWVASASSCEGDSESVKSAPSSAGKTSHEFCDSPDSSDVPVSEASSAFGAISASASRSYGAIDLSGGSSRDGDGLSYEVEGIDGEGAISDSEDEAVHELMLPHRLFATDRYPTGGRINSYSKLQYLADILSILDGTPQYATLLNSCFGSLFKLPVRQCLFSGKFVHNLICRQLVTKNSRELWITFGGQPLRFSLREFEVVTGLPCGPYPGKCPRFESGTTSDARSAFWDELFGPRDDVTIKDIVEMLRLTPDMDPLRKLQLVLIVIVDGILICGTQPLRPSPDIVDMVSDLDVFFRFPWGRLAFERTLRMVRVGDMLSRVSKLTDKLKQKSLVVHGFPVSIQLFLFRSVPLLLRHVPFAEDEKTFLDSRLTRLPMVKTFHTENIIQVENDPKLSVQYVVPLVLEDVRVRVPFRSVSDPKILNLVRLLEGGHRFLKSDWCGGDDVLPQLCICKKRKNLRCKCAASVSAQSGSVPMNPLNLLRGDQPAVQIAKLTEEVVRLRRGHGAELKKFKEDLLTEMRLLVGRRIPAGLSDSTHVGVRVDQDANLSSDKVEDSRDDAEVQRCPPSSPEKVDSIPQGFGGVCHSTFVTFRSTDMECPLSGDPNTSGDGHIPFPAPPSRSVQSSTQPASGDANLRDSTCDLHDSTLVPGMRASISSLSPDTNDPLHRSPTSSHVQLDEDPLSGPEVGVQSTVMAKDPLSTTDVGGQSTVMAKVDIHVVLVNYVLVDPVPVPIDQAPPLRERPICSTRALRPRSRLNLPSSTLSLRRCPAVLDDNILSPVSPPFDPFPLMCARVVKKFKDKLSSYIEKSYEIDGCEVSNSFFSEIYKPQQWVTYTHMNFMIRALWKKHGSRLLRKGIVILDSLLTQLLVSQYLPFMQSARTGDYVWHPLLRSFVDGTFGDRTERSTWFKDVSTIYVPMNWGNKHWVALVISLKEWHIDILDPLLYATAERKVSSFMGPFVKMLPLLIKAMCDVDDYGDSADTEFTFVRVKGLAQNYRSGDCGPFSIKLMELHSNGCSTEQLADIDEKMVDQFRLQYAVNVYEEFVEKLM